MKDKVIIIIGVVSIIVSCNKNINSLDQEILSYKQLPKPVKERLFDLYGDLPKEKKIKAEYLYFFRDLNKPLKYEYYIKKELFFNWIYDGYIKNIETGNIYLLEKKSEVERGEPNIIYGDSLYIPNHYNIFAQDSLNYTFTKFILK